MEKMSRRLSALRGQEDGTVFEKNRGEGVMNDKLSNSSSFGGTFLLRKVWV